MRLNQVRLWAAAVLMVAGWGSFAVAEAVDVPAGALLPGTSVVIWAETEGFNEPSMRAAFEAVVAVAPEQDQEGMRGKMNESLVKMKPVFDAGQQLREDGVSSAVIAVAPQDDPSAKPLVQLLLKAKPGSNPKASVAQAARSLNAWMVESGEGKALSEEELDAKLAEMKFTKINESWHAVELPDTDFAPLPAADEALDPQPFIKAINGEDGAPVRFAFLMNDVNRDAIKQSAADPNNMMMAGLITPLISLDSATGGLWLGQQPKVRVSMNFADEASAMQFKTALDQMLGFFGMMMASQGAQNPNAAGQAPNTAQVQAVLPLLYLDQEGAVVSKTFDTSVLTKLSEAGIPWSQVN